MDVAGPEADPEHGRQMPDRVAAVGVEDQFWLGGRSGGEIKQQRIVRHGGTVGRERRSGTRRVVFVPPRLAGIADDDLEHAVLAAKLAYLVSGSDDGLDVAAPDAIGQ